MAVLKSTLKLTLLDNVTAHARRISTVLGGLRRQQTAFMAPLRGGIGQLMAFGAGYLGVTAGIRGTAGAAMDFESAFADVRKVLNGSDEQLANVRRSILDMSKDLPIAASGIAEIYAAAGQANIPMAELNKFGEMVAKVSTAWEVPVAETGQALAEIKNQLNLGVAEVGLFADAINHLSNNTAANAPRLLDYTKRVAANGEMFGYTATQTLAFGGAMIATGAQSEVAATSFRNMGRALTKGTQATKMQRTAMSKLGLDSVKTAKNMQKDAIGTTLDVIEKIQSLPEWERISVASALFGDEARALMPIINNSTELRRQLDMVGSKANYAGSAFEEYRKRAETTANQLAKVKNNLMAVGIAIGDSMLPAINRALTGILDIFATLGERVTVFDKIGTAIKGFAQGLDGGGAFSKMIADLKELLFGEVDGAAAADKLGQIFAKFKEWGANVRELSAAIADNPLVKLFASIAPYGFDLMLWGVGISFLAGTISKLAKALMFLSGASTAVGIIKAVGAAVGVGGGAAAVGGAATGAGVAGGAAATATGVGVAGVVTGAAVAAGVAAGTAHIVKELGAANAAEASRMATPRGAEDASMLAYKKYLNSGNLDADLGDRKKPAQEEKSVGWLKSLDNWIVEKFPSMKVNTGEATPGNATAGAPPITAETLRAATAPQGTQDVRITNPIAPNITVNAPITINEASNGQATAGAVSSQLGSTVKSAAESSYMDAQ